MKDLDIKLLNKIKENCDKNISFIEEVADVLDISYDAAYRRINQKTKLSLEDAIKLSLHFNISLDSLFDEKLSYKKIIINKSEKVSNIYELENYFEKIIKNLLPIKNKEDVNILYAAKDLPLFYFARNPLFSKFKSYTILYLLDKDFPLKKITFESFKLSSRLNHLISSFGEMYYNFNITEIWNERILEQTINQILYFYEIKLLNYATAIKLCDTLKIILEKIEKDTFRGRRNNRTNSKIRLFNSPLLPLNNDVIIKTKNKKTLLSPYLLINYYVIEDQQYIEKYLSLLNNQLHLSNNINNAGVKERMLFFNPKYKQIEKAIQRIELLKQFPI